MALVKIGIFAALVLLFGVIGFDYQDVIKTIFAIVLVVVIGLLSLFFLAWVLNTEVTPFFLIKAHKLKKLKKKKNLKIVMKEKLMPCKRSIQQGQLSMTAKFEFVGL
ncbi:hypothetical protein [Thiomicrorhabdus sp. Milos-T2]|uniref:hypothetical protein n=1 Tax=Thiomicrorhabdus sp. Milos-T2 TaxID=90814 RepID=UPI0004945C8E|nr:hypothetical protein [Thiomicrorhabdus sp. Milos-T2]